MPSPFLALPLQDSTNFESLQTVWALPGGLPGYIHVTDVGARRPAPQERLQALEGLLVAVCQDLDGIVRAVAHPASHPQRARRLQRGGAKPDALHPSLDDGEEALHGRARRRKPSGAAGRLTAALR